MFSNGSKFVIRLIVVKTYKGKIYNEMCVNHEDQFINMNMYD